MWLRGILGVKWLRWQLSLLTSLHQDVSRHRQCNYRHVKGDINPSDKKRIAIPLIE